MDDETELLLNVTRDYKIRKRLENLDWESVRSKYEYMLKLMYKALPNSRDNIVANNLLCMMRFNWTRMSSGHVIVNCLNAFTPFTHE